MNLDDKEIIDLLQYSFVRMDGAWFLGLAKKHGIETAWEMDVEAWKHFSYVFGRRIQKKYIPEPQWPSSFIDALSALSRVLKIEGREVEVDGDRIIVRVTDCETQKAIAKAGIADCGIVTVETYLGLARALFGDSFDINVEHTKNLNQGADCCEVVITGGKS
ncbi:MAG TPA: DUF6125 family protein [Spirochaetota bacterium]|nr:DUF6125 family protein [Spirochaetota bacterium]HPJ34558.1 DUF6125 family protein [Spirochaetota bacterium]